MADLITKLEWLKMVSFILFLNKAKNFLVSNYKIVIPLLILAYCIYKYNDAVGDKIQAQKELAQHIQSDKDAQIKREAENKLNAILAQKKTDADVAKHKAELSKIIAKGKKDETVSNRVISNYRDSLRDKINNQATIRLLEDDTNRLTSTDSHSALLRPIHEIEAELATCKEAGAVAAADYNLCKSYVDNQQSILGVSE